MRFHFNAVLSCRLLAFVCIFCMQSTVSGQDQDQSFVGVFQFVASTIDVVGLEDDVSYNVRNELRKSSGLLVINQRELELSLSRNDIDQNFSAQEAVKAANILNLNYVIIGKVSRDAQQILANIEVVSPIAGESIGVLSFTFNNQAHIALQANYIGQSIIDLITEHKLIAQSTTRVTTEDWVGEMSASYQGGLVSLSWTMNDPSSSFLGFNVYRSNNEEGPFSYITSEAELSAKDKPTNNPGTYYYQLSMINDEGEEIRSEKLVSVIIQAEVKSSLAPPTVVNVIERVSGISVDFFPSADNSSKAILGYELLRRAAGEDFKVVDSYTKSNTAQSSQNSTSGQSNIEKRSLSDSETLATQDTLYYGVRAFSALEKGQISEAIEFTPASAPQLQLISSAVQRQITLGWQSATAGFGYRLYRRKNSDADWRIVSEQKGLDNVSYTDTDFTQEDQTFEYAISVYDDFGETGLSDVLLAKSKSELAPPTEVKGVSGLAKKAIITWQINPEPDVTGYSIFRVPYTESEGFTLTRIGQVNDPMATSFTDNTIAEDTGKYYYAVASINKLDRSGPISKAIVVSTKEPPSPLTSLQAVLGDAAIELSWVLPENEQLSDIATIQIQRSLDQQIFETIASISPAQTTYSDTKLISGTSPVYQAIIIDNDGLKSTPSLSETNMVTLPLVLSVAEDGMLRKVSLAWQNASAPAAIKVFRGTQENDLALVGEVLANNENTYIDENDLIDEQTYFVKIEAWFAESKVAESNIVTTTTKTIPAPKNLTAQSGLPNQIKLSWEAVVDSSVNKYVLFRRDLSQSNNELESIAVIEDVAITSYTDSVFNTQRTANQLGDSIKHGVEYEYAIASKNIFDATGYIGNRISAASKKLPQWPFDVKVNTSPKSIAIEWALGSETDLSHIVIERQWPFEDGYTEVARLPATATSFNDTDLYPYVSPAYRLTVIDSDNLSSVATIIEQIQNENNSTLQVVKDGLLRQVQLGWDIDNPAIDVQILRRTKNSDFNVLATLASEVKTYTDTTNLLDQTQYDYQLSLQTKAVPPFVLGTSNIVTGNTKDLPSPPNFRAQSGAVKSVTLSWEPTADSDIGGYNIYKIEPNGKLEKLDTLTPEQNSYTDDGSFFSKLEDGTEYQYKIGSFNIHNVEGLHSEVVRATTKALPNIPLSVNAAIAPSSPVTNVLVNWLPSSQADIAKYEVYRGSNCNRVRVLASVNANTSTRYTDSDISAGRSYCYKVKALDTSGLESALSRGAELSIPEGTE